MSIKSDEPNRVASIAAAEIIKNPLADPNARVSLKSPTKTIVEQTPTP